MATALNVAQMLRPNGGYVIRGENFEDIEFIEANPFSKEEFFAGFAEYDKWLADEQKKRADAKSALLAKLGITEAEAKLLLS